MSDDKRETGKNFLKLCISVIVTLLTTIVFLLCGMAIARMFHIQGALDFMAGKPRQYSLKGTASYAMVGSMQELGFIVGPLLAVHFICRKRVSYLGLTSLKKDGKELLVGILAGTVAMTVVFGVLVLLGSVRIQSVSFLNPGVFIIELVIYILVGIGEEVFSRGLFQSILRETKKRFLVFFIPSVFFGAMHLANKGVTLLSVLNLILLGLIFAYAFYRSGSLWLPIGLHITWNFFQGVVYGFPVSGNTDAAMIKQIPVKLSLLNGGSFGPEGGMLVSIMVVILFLGLHYYYRNYTYDFMENE